MPGQCSGFFLGKDLIYQTLIIYRLHLALMDKSYSKRKDFYRLNRFSEHFGTIA